MHSTPHAKIFQVAQNKVLLFYATVQTVRKFQKNPPIACDIAPNDMKHIRHSAANIVLVSGVISVYLLNSTVTCQTAQKIKVAIKLHQNIKEWWPHY
jgi:hypothetical protein